MMYVDFVANGNEYKLRLNTRDIVALEKKIGCNPMGIFISSYGGQRIPTVTEMIAILHQSMQTYHHNINNEKATDIFDEWLADGNSASDFVNVIFDIYKASGIITDTEKN